VIVIVIEIVIVKGFERRRHPGPGGFPAAILGSPQGPGFAAANR